MKTANPCSTHRPRASANRTRNLSTLSTRADGARLTCTCTSCRPMKRKRHSPSSCTSGYEENVRHPFVASRSSDTLSIDPRRECDERLARVSLCENGRPGEAFSLLITKIDSPRTPCLPRLGPPHRSAPRRHVRSQPLHAGAVRRLYPLARDQSRALERADSSQHRRRRAGPYATGNMVSDFPFRMLTSEA